MNGRRAASVAGVAGPAVFLSAAGVLGALRPGYDPRRRFVSDLARGPRGGLMRAAFAVGGTGILVGSSAAPGRALRATLAVIGGGLALSGAFRTDGTDVASTTPEGAVHGVLGAAVFTGLVVAPALAARSAVLPPGFRRASAAISATTGAGNVLLKIAQLVPALAGIRGAVQRAVLVAGLGWVAALQLAP